MSDNGRAHVSQDARELYSDGLNCAESVIGALSDVPGLPMIPPSLGAGFTAGIGHQGCVCGALAGGVAVLGEYASRQGLEPAAARQLAEELSAALHATFTDRFGSTCCRVIKRNYAEGSDAWLSHCATLTEETAGMIAGIVEKHQREARRARWAARDMMSAVRRTGLDGLAGSGIALAAALAVPANSRGQFLSVCIPAFVLLGLTLEVGGSRPRRAGRYLRAAGAVAAGVLAVVAALTSHAAASVFAELLADTSAGMMVARAVLATCVLAVTATSLFTIKRYR